jgi:hypothetical protein
MCLMMAQLKVMHDVAAVETAKSEAEGQED